MKLSVVIPCYNAAIGIGSQLEAMTTQCWSEPWEIIVSDNGSTDESLAIIERYKERLPNLRVVDSSGRRGSSYARNVGVRAATGEAILFCDADDEVGFGWLAAMGNALCKYDAVACRVDYKKLNKPWMAEHFKNHPQHTGLQRTWYPPYFLHAGGGSLGVKRIYHQVIGGFDESLPRLVDTDYCYRLQRAGVELYFEPNAVLHIRCRDKLATTFHQARLWAKYSVFMYKRYGAGGGHSYPWKRYATEWGHIIRGWRSVFSEQARFGWVCRVAWQIGLLQGSIEHRVPPVSW
jgi:glycosyltransferase involved in cell wall biosynthesis